MLQTITTILIVLWLLGLVTSTTLGGFIHLLLVIAIVLFVVRVISGARVWRRSRAWRQVLARY